MVCGCEDNRAYQYIPSSRDARSKIEKRVSKKQVLYIQCFRKRSVFVRGASAWRVASHGVGGVWSADITWLLAAEVKLPTLWSHDPPTSWHFLVMIPYKKVYKCSGSVL